MSHTPEETARQTVLEAKKAANVADASQPVLTADEATELANLQAK